MHGGWPHACFIPPHTHTLLPAAQVPDSETGKESLWWFRSSRWAEADVAHLRKVRMRARGGSGARNGPRLSDWAHLRKVWRAREGLVWLKARDGLRSSQWAKADVAHYLRKV